MTYRNDPYDPKQAALLGHSALEDAVAQAEKAFADAADLDGLAAVRHQHLGDRAAVSLARREIGGLPPAAKSEAGQRVNTARAAIQLILADTAQRGYSFLHEMVGSFTCSGRVGGEAFEAEGLAVVEHVE